MNTTESIQFYRKLKSEYNIPDFRFDQVISLSNCLFDFNFDYLESIETGASQNFDDGCFGLFIGHLTSTKSGKMSSVDNNPQLVELSKNIYKEFLPELSIEHYCEDSIKFLNEYEGKPNLVHLDSWDLDLKNPIPSMLHGWLEFVAIKDKMPKNSIIVVDDNFMKGTWVTWNWYENGVWKSDERIDINYDIIGKGSLIYHYCQKSDSDWKIMGSHYITGNNVKVIIKKGV
jgi:hypothetical protein